MVELTKEHDLETLRQISLLLDRENQRLITKTLELTAEVARLRGVSDPTQLQLAVLQELEQRRAQLFHRNARASSESSARPQRPPQPGHGARAQPALPVVEIRHELPADDRQCPACCGELMEMAGQVETSERITTIKLTYHVEHHVRQKYRCRCNGAVVTAPGPAQVAPGSRYAPEFGVGVAVAKYADHLPLERQVRMMAREGLTVDSQTLWDQINAIAHHLAPTYEALGRRALEAPVINVDETRWAMMGSLTPAKGTVWTVHSPVVSFYRILPGKSADEGRLLLNGYRGTVVADGFAVYDVLARDGLAFTLAHCWAHAKRKYDEILEHWPVACAEIGTLVGELYAIERLVPGPFPGDAAAQELRRHLRHERSRPVLDQIWQWATVQVGLPRSDFGKAVRYMLERWEGLTRFVEDPCVPLDNNAAERALRGPVVGRKNHYGSRSLRGTQVAALFFTLCETAKLAGVDPHSYVLRALYTAIAQPGAVTYPEDLLISTPST
jgi:transposase